MLFFKSTLIKTQIEQSSQWVFIFYQLIAAIFILQGNTIFLTQRSTVLTVQRLLYLQAHV